MIKTSPFSSMFFIAWYLHVLKTRENKYFYPLQDKATSEYPRLHVEISAICTAEKFIFQTREGIETMYGNNLLEVSDKLSDL